jgi:Outer membrane protein beta-barrel domain
MKKLLFLSILLLICMYLTAGQPIFNLGIKGGLTASELKFSDTWNYSSDNTVSYHIGGFARVGVGRFFIQPEAYFNSRGGDLKEIIDDNPVTTVANFDFSSVDVPLLAGIKFGKGKNFNIRAMGGPIFGFITSKKVEGTSDFNADYFNNHFYGWQYGIGFDIWFLTLDARIESSRNSVYQSSEFSTKNKVYLFSVGIKFL